ncbi:MAG TPA: DUF5990 family protein [Acidimicrobiales bacterium]
MQIRIEGRDLPGASCGPGPDYPGGHPNIHVAVQRRAKPAELFGLVRGDAAEAVWTLECEDVDRDGAVDLKGPYIQGPPGGRFVYLNWGVVDDDGGFRMFRRAKVLLETVPVDVLARARRSGTLVATVGLTDEKGNPTCAAFRPPLIEWAADA